jgi:hypothetical protein
MAQAWGAGFPRIQRVSTLTAQMRVVANNSCGDHSPYLLDHIEPRYV